MCYWRLECFTHIQHSLLQVDGFRLSCSPSSHSTTLGGDYRTHAAGTLRHDWDRHGTIQPPQRSTHPRCTSLTDWIQLCTETHTHTRILSKTRSRSDKLCLRMVYSISCTLMGNNNVMQLQVAKHQLRQFNFQVSFKQTVVSLQASCWITAGNAARTKHFLKTGLTFDNQQLFKPKIKPTATFSHVLFH